MRHSTGGPSTRAIHAGGAPAVEGAPVVSPIVPSTTFYSDPSGQGEVLYTRYGNGPNQRLLEQRLSALEGSEDALVLASGMAAMAVALLSLLRAGDHVVATDAIYGGTRALLADELSRLGIETTFVLGRRPCIQSSENRSTKVVAIPSRDSSSPSSARVPP